jgi:hypothetical protein
MAGEKVVGMSVIEIGCCGAYCKTCRALVPGGNCLGCKLGYDTGERDINKARCAIKICCFRDKKLSTCAGCTNFSSCETIQGFYAKRGYKYGKYRQALEYIRENGYDRFIAIADKWTGPYGRLG